MIQVHKDNQVHLDHKALKVPKEILDRRDWLDRQALEVHLDLKVHKVTRDYRVQQVLQALPGQLDQQGL